MKPFYSVDCETTGLDRANDMLLELAVIYEDPSKKLTLEEIPKFHCFVTHKQYRASSPYALSLNKRIFDQLILHEKKKPTLAPVYDLETAINKLCQFIESTVIPNDEIRFTGKNFASFDLQLLQRDGINTYIKYNHRYLDIGSLLFNPKTMDWLPSSDECYKIAGITTPVTHSALLDAWDVVQIIRTTY